MHPMRSITVVIAHPEKASRERCLRLLEPQKGIQVVAEARSTLEALVTTIKVKPRILLLDVNLCPMHGLALFPVLRQKSPRTKVILLTRGTAGARLLEALSRGALGYLETKALQTFLAKAVRVVDAGEAWVPRKMVARLVDRLARLTLRVRVPLIAPTKVHWTKVQ